MSEKPILINKKINDLEIKMLRKNQDCYIKIEPITQKSNPKILIIMINGEKHQFDIYDKNGRESHKIYLKGNMVTPCFYILDDEIYFKILCNNNDIIVTKKSKEYNNKFNLSEIYNCISTKISCWAVNIYMTSRTEKPPFCDM